MKNKVCNCGNSIKERVYITKAGNKKYMPKYCSRKCAYSFRVRPQGLEYEIVAVNKSWFKKGSSGFIGTRTEETKKKLSDLLKGRRISPMTEFKKGQTSGDKNINWKGGITPINMKIRQSLEYKDWRTNVFKRDDYTCQECGSRGVTLHADHINPFAYFPELRLVIDNGRTLCVPCHRKTPTYSLGARKIYGTKKV